MENLKEHYISRRFSIDTLKILFETLPTKVKEQNKGIYLNLKKNLKTFGKEENGL